MPINGMPGSTFFIAVQADCAVELIQVGHRNDFSTIKQVGACECCRLAHKIDGFISKVWVTADPHMQIFEESIGWYNAISAEMFG